MNPSDPKRKAVAVDPGASGGTVVSIATNPPGMLEAFRDAMLNLPSVSEAESESLAAELRHALHAEALRLSAGLRGAAEAAEVQHPDMRIRRGAKPNKARGCGVTRKPSTKRLSHREAVRHMNRDRDAIKRVRDAMRIWNEIGGGPTAEEVAAWSGDGYIAAVLGSARPFGGP